MKDARRTLPLFILFFVINYSVCFAQLDSLNLVYSGTGGLSDVIKFAHDYEFFKKQRLGVTLIYVNSGVLASQVVASGTAQRGGHHRDRRAKSHGGRRLHEDHYGQYRPVPASFCCPAGYQEPFWDMKGKRVAVSRYGSFSDIQTRFLVRQWGLDPDKDVQILQIGNSSRERPR